MSDVKNRISRTFSLFIPCDKSLSAIKMEYKTTLRKLETKSDYLHDMSGGIENSIDLYRHVLQRKKNNAIRSFLWS